MAAYSTLQNTQLATYSVNLTSSALVKTGTGNVQGIVVNSNSSGTLKLWDSLTAANTVLFNTITFAAGSQTFNLFGARFVTGLFATIGGTADITILYN